jgi:ADP-ribose pyrophosphatase YjhB (NUDIX family)
MLFHKHNNNRSKNLAPQYKKAARQFLEETSLEVDLGEVLSVHSNFHDPERLTVGIWFAGRVMGGALRPGDDLD